MDKSARQCREAGLVLPDEIMTYFFFEHSNSSMERQANILLRTGGEYTWSKVKQAVDLLYPQTYVHQRRDNQQYRQGKGRTARETGTWEEPHSADTTNMDIEDWLYYEDPVERLAESDSVGYLPEPLARELHEVFATHRENRAKLARAVKARGFYTNKGKGKGKPPGKKGKSSGALHSPQKGDKGSRKGGKGKARGGMSLDELKKVTACGDCQQLGHWKGDPQCPKATKKAHETHTIDLDPDEIVGEVDSWWDEDYWEAHEVSTWATQRQESPVKKVEPTKNSKDAESELYVGLTVDEADDVVRGINQLKRKVADSRPRSSKDTALIDASRGADIEADIFDRKNVYDKKPLDVFTATALIQEKIEERKMKAKTTAPEAVAEAYTPPWASRQRRSRPLFGTAWRRRPPMTWTSSV